MLFIVYIKYLKYSNLHCTILYYIIVYIILYYAALYCIVPYYMWYCLIQDVAKLYYEFKSIRN